MPIQSILSVRLILKESRVRDLLGRRGVEVYYVEVVLIRPYTALEATMPQCGSSVGLDPLHVAL